ncbi:MAG: sigma 54-interacting transcriptional regulator [Eubacteriaceae bacterium]|nr:sigma 54-interacting transcriptional regulator [Eubacteriaceae bacterium]
MRLMDIMDSQAKIYPDADIDQNKENLISADLSVYSLDIKRIPNDIIYVEKDSQIIGCVNKNLIQYLCRFKENKISHKILNEIEEGVVAIDETGRIFYANNSYTKILGVPLHRIIGKMMQDVEEGATIIKLLKTHKPILKKNNYIKSLDKFVNVRIFPIYDENKFVGAFSIFDDVTKINHLNQEVIRVSQIAEEYNRQLEAKKKMKELNIIGKSPDYLKVVAKALTVAKTNVNVLVLGENGSGKDLICNLIHQNSERSKKPFISLNCAAIPENLIESEMFGYEPGAFTGASKDGKIGKFQLADHGTLFLDEIADMSLSMQAKLLRALETGEIERIGGNEKIKVDVRIVAATNKILEEEIEKGNFREDLYYRLSVISLEVPPLRERGHDVSLFIHYFLEYYNEMYKKNLTISDSVLNHLTSYTWPGNVRELKNCMEHAVILSNEDIITMDRIPAKVQRHTARCSNHSLAEIMYLKERKAIVDALQYYQFNIQKTAKALKVSERTMYRKIKNHGIDLTNLSKEAL